MSFILQTGDNKPVSRDYSSCDQYCALRDCVGLSLSPGLSPREIDNLHADNIIMILTLKGD